MNKFSGLRPAVVASVLAAISGCHRGPQPAEVPATPKQQAPGDAAGSEFAAVTADAQMARRLGLELATVASSRSAAATQGTATVLDSAAFTAVLAEIEAARADAASAHDNYNRLQQLYADDGNASRQAVEAASAQWSTARARVATAEARARSDWGSQLIDPDNGHSALRRDLESGRVTMLRAEFADTLPAAAEQLEYALLGSNAGESMAHPLVYLARSHAPAVAAGGASVLLRVKDSADENLGLRPGSRLPVIATRSTGPTRPLVPAAAAFADGGQFWCYVARAGGRYERVPLDSTERVAGGYPVASGVKEGDQVVVRGAPLLLSLERGAGSVADAE